MKIKQTTHWKAQENTKSLDLALLGGTLHGEQNKTSSLFGFQAFNLVYLGLYRLPAKDYISLIEP